MASMRSWSRRASPISSSFDCPFFNRLGLPNLSLTRNGAPWFPSAPATSPFYTIISGVETCSPRGDQRSACTQAARRGDHFRRGAHTERHAASAACFVMRSVVYLLSGTQVVLALSYLKPGAFFRSSLVSSRVSHHLSFFLAVLTAVKGTMTSFSPAPRKPPTPMTSPVTFPDLSTRTSSTSPIFDSFGS